MSEKKPALSQAYITRDLRLFFVLLAVLLGTLIAMYYYDMRYPFVNMLAEKFFFFLLK